MYSLYIYIFNAMLSIVARVNRVNKAIFMNEWKSQWSECDQIALLTWLCVRLNLLHLQIAEPKRGKNPNDTASFFFSSLFYFKVNYFMYLIVFSGFILATQIGFCLVSWYILVCRKSFSQIFFIQYNMENDFI